MENSQEGYKNRKKNGLKMNTLEENFNILWNGILLRAEPKETGRIYSTNPFFK